MENIFNVKDFLNGFDDLIPYEINVIVGGVLADHFIISEANISSDNHKGKLYPAFDRTKESKNAIMFKYEPADELSLPIDIFLAPKYPYSIIFDDDNDSLGITAGEKCAKKSCKMGLIDSNSQQVGSIILEFNKSGDIIRKTCFYYSKTGKHKIRHSVEICFVAPKSLHIIEHASYTEYYLEFGTETTVDIYKVNGVTTCITIRNEKTKTFKEKMFEPSLDLSQNFNNLNGILYLSRSIILSNEYIPEIGVITSWESYILNRDLTKKGFDDWRVGRYVGHTLVKDSNRLSLCIHNIKDGYNLYLLVDITGTNPFKATNPLDDFDDEVQTRDEIYLDMISHQCKTPLFITETDTDGKESLVGYKGILFKDYCLYKGINIKGILNELTKKGYNLSEEQSQIFDLIIKLRDMGLTSNNGQTITEDLEEIALKEFELFKKKYITPFEGIKDFELKQLIRR